MTRLVDELIERKKRNQKYFDNYLAYAAEIRQLARKSLPDARVLVFGSVVKGNWIPNKSDIDILIISQSVSKSAGWQSELKLKILKEFGDLSAPFEFHFVTPEQYAGWYHKFIRNDYLEV